MALVYGESKIFLEVFDTLSNGEKIGILKKEQDMRKVKYI